MAITDYLSLEELEKLNIPVTETIRSNPLQFSYMPETIRSNPLQFAFEDATNPYSRRQTNALKLLRMPGTVFNEKLEGGDIGFFGDSTSGYDYDPSAGTKEDFNYLYGTRPAFERDVGGGITQLDLSRFQGVSDLGRDDEDVEQVEYLTEPTGIRKLLQYLPFGDKSLLRRGFEGISNLIPRRDPRAMAMQNFYGSRFGLTPTGSVASGIMAGYNPVSGFGKNKNIGLARAMQKRIERIQETLKKKDSAQLENRLENLRNLQRQEIRDRSDRGESLSDIGKSTFSGKGMAFEKGAGKVR